MPDLEPVPESPPLVAEVRVPTYQGAIPEVDNDETNEYEHHGATICVRDEDGLALYLRKPGGPADPEDNPAIIVERRPHGWAIHLNVYPKSDPAGYLYIHDDPEVEECGIELARDDFEPYVLVQAPGADPLVNVDKPAVA